MLEAQRLEERTRFDLEMMKELGYCHGIENYSRHLTGRAPGEPPPTLLDYLPRESLVVIDESHITIPQLGGMFRGDQSRKQTLVDYGFRLPSALDNRPLCFEEFEARVGQRIYVSATPGPYEVKQADGRIVEQIVRPTGLMDPQITVKPAANQVDDLLGEIRARLAKGERVLVTTLTKRMAEDLTEYYQDLGLKVRYLHSDITTLERMEIIRDLRLGVFDVLVGINLLREGLDLPEVSLVAILDADKEGFLRSARSLIQTCGRAARNVNGQVLFYADRVTPSMAAAIEETNRRRRVQEIYNQEHGITPETIQSQIKDVLASVYEADYVTVPLAAEEQMPYLTERPEVAIKRLKKEMQAAAKKQEFERAATLRDRIRTLEAENLKYAGVIFWGRGPRDASPSALPSNSPPQPLTGGWEGSLRGGRGTFDVPRPSPQNISKKIIQRLKAAAHGPGEIEVEDQHIEGVGGPVEALEHGQGRIELPVGAPVALFQLPDRHVFGVVNHLEAAVVAPVVVKDAPVLQQFRLHLGAGAGGQDEHERGRGLDAIEEIHRGLEDLRPVAIEPEHDVHRKADAPVPQAFELPFIILGLILLFVDGLEAFRADGLHADVHMAAAAAGQEVQHLRVIPDVGRGQAGVIQLQGDEALHDLHGVAAVGHEVVVHEVDKAAVG